MRRDALRRLRDDCRNFFGEEGRASSSTRRSSTWMPSSERTSAIFEDKDKDGGAEQATVVSGGSHYKGKVAKRKLI